MSASSSYLIDTNILVNAIRRKKGSWIFCGSWFKLEARWGGRW
jgi:hypothetical protein